MDSTLWGRVAGVECRGKILQSHCVRWSEASPALTEGPSELVSLQLPEGREGNFIVFQWERFRFCSCYSGNSHIPYS